MYLVNKGVLKNVTSFLISGEDREILSYVLVNRVRELQSYKPRIEELQENLRGPVTSRHVLAKAGQTTGRFPIRMSILHDTFKELDKYTCFKSFDTNGNLMKTRDRCSLDTRAFTLDQWIIILEPFFKNLQKQLDPEWVKVVEDIDLRRPISEEALLDIESLYFINVFFGVKIILEAINDEKAAWTLEIEGLRRELDHMGDKILALITDLSLNR